MDAPSSSVNPKGQHLLPLVFKIAFVCGVFIQSGVLYIVLRDSPPPAEQAPADVLIYTLAGGGFISLAAGFMLPSMLFPDGPIVEAMRDAVRNARAEGGHVDEEQSRTAAWKLGFPRYFTRCLLSFAMVEATGILGIVLGLLGADPTYAYGMLGCALVGLVVLPVNGLPALVQRAVREA